MIAQFIFDGFILVFLVFVVDPESALDLVNEDDFEGATFVAKDPSSFGSLASLVAMWPVRFLKTVIGLFIASLVGRFNEGEFSN